MAWLPFAKLEITDGTTTINLLNQQKSGFCITDWQPAIQDLKAGGTWADPPTADERELIVSQLANVEDQFTFDVSAASPDELIALLRDLRAMLEKGRTYTTTRWQDTSVYIIAQGYGDTNARYTRVKNWRTPQDGFPYGPPMWDTLVGNAIEDFSIIIEHGAWADNIPGQGTATEISAVETYDGRNLGNVDSSQTRDPTTSNEVYVGNKSNVANLSDIYVDDGGVFGANLMDAALPYNLLPAVPAVNDAIYFGIDTTPVNSGPFCSLVFDIGTGGFDYAGAWEYWNGAAWAAITTVTDLTDDGAIPITPFELTGVNAVSWNQPSNWATRDLSLDGGPAITGYWVRLRVTIIGGALVSPTQQNRDVYSVVWPYIEIQSAQVPGDIPAIAEIEFYGQSDRSVQYNRHSNRVIWGLRTYDRGANFTAYLNFSGIAQNPGGVNGLAVAPGASVTDVRSSTGIVISWAPAGAASDVNIARVQIDSSIVQEFYGQYHMFLRAIDDTGTATVTFYATYKERNGNAIRSSKSDSELDVSQEWGFMDLGLINIPSSDQMKFGNPARAFDIDIYGNTDGAAAVKLNDIVLIPVDEYAMDCLFDIRPLSSGQSVESGEKLNMDGIIAPKYGNVVTTEEISTGFLDVGWLSIASGKIIIQANTRQRLWFVTAARQKTPDSNAINISTPYNLDSVLVFRQSLYWSMRGTG